MDNTLPTRDLLICTGMEFVESVGFNAFSYRDLAERIGIRTASIHYHFPLKSDLGREMLIKHRKDNGEFFAQLDASGGTAYQRLARYLEAFRKSYSNSARICFGGMMASDSESLSDDVLAEVRGCFQDHEQWLAEVIKAGQKDGSLRSIPRPQPVAQAIFDALQGAMLATRAFRKPQRMSATVQWCLAQVRAGKQV